MVFDPTLFKALILPAATFVGGFVASFVMFLHGNFAIRMTVALELERLSKDDSNDYLSTTINLSDGKNGSIVIYEIGYRLLVNGKTIEQGTFPNTCRLQDCEKKIVWDSLKEGNGITKIPYLRITPGEQKQYSVASTIPKDAVVTADVVLIGKKDFSPFPAQWRTNKISFPNA